MAPDALTGLVLAGGRARRMQSDGLVPASATSSSGRFFPVRPIDSRPDLPLLEAGNADERGAIEKGLLTLCGEPLVSHARRLLAPHARQVLISANRHADRYAAYGVVVPDDPALGDDVGPLAGVASALARADTEWVMCLPVDVLNPAADLVGRLMEAVRQTGRPAAFACSDRDHPLCALIHRRLKDDLYSFLASGGRRVRTWLARHDAVALRFMPDPSQFFNINTPEDLCEAEKMLACIKQAAGR